MEKLKSEKEIIEQFKSRAPLIIRPPRQDELPLCNKRPRPRGVAFTQLWERTEIKEGRDD